jgi:hypothetical protein
MAPARARRILVRQVSRPNETRDSTVTDQGSVWSIAPAPQRRASEWWDNARASRTAPNAVRPLPINMPPDEIQVSEAEAEAEAEEIARWAANLPGWEAPDPGIPPVLVIRPVT